MTLLDAFKLQVILLLMGAVHLIVMGYFYPQRSMNPFHEDNVSLVVFLCIWLGVCTYFRWYWQVPLIGWIGYFV